jgi:two-component system NtrC family response regulator
MEAVELRELSLMMSKKPAALRVLVVDDEPLIRWSLAQTLTDRGYVVVETEDAASTRAALKDGFDVVLLDYRLPDSNDLSLLESIRDRVPHAPVILMTAYGAPEVVRGALDLGAYRVISKPFDMSAVADLVAQAHGEAAARGSH